MRTILELIDANGHKPHTFFANGDRYAYDFKRCRSADGWRQFDTHQDAWYFGIWYHPERRVVVTYAEGDEYIEVYLTDEEWRVKMKEMSEFYGAPPPMAVGIDTDGSVTHYFDAQARPNLEV